MIRAHRLIKNVSGRATATVGLFVPNLRHRDFWIDRETAIAGDAPKVFLHAWEPGTVRRRRDTWPAHIAKLGHKWYPNESITEHLLTRVGQVLGVDVATTTLRRIDGELRLLSRYFLHPSHQQLVHGTEVLAEHWQDESFLEQLEGAGMDRALLGFSDIEDALRAVFPAEADGLLVGFVRMLIFDAITGNNDRHHMNWGVVASLTGEAPTAFAPVFDSARGLFWNWDDAKVAGLTNLEADSRAKRLQRYVMGSKPKLGVGGREATHFGLIEDVLRGRPSMATAVRDLVELDVNGAVARVLADEFVGLMTRDRRVLILDCLEARMVQVRRAYARAGIVPVGAKT